MQAKQMAIFAAAGLSIGLGLNRGAQAAYTLEYVFDQSSYTIQDPGGKAPVRVSLKETVSGADTSILGTTGLAGAGLRLNYGTATPRASVAALADVAAVAPLGGADPDLTDPSSVAELTFALSNIVANGVANGDGSISYTIPVAVFTFTADSLGPTTLTTGVYLNDGGSYTTSSNGETKIPLDGRVTFGNTATITVVPEPTLLGLVCVGGMLILRRRSRA